MIVTSRHREAVRLLQDDAAALRAQLATLVHQMEALSAQMAVQQERLGAGEARATQLESRIAALNGIVADQAAALATQALLIDVQAGDLDRLEDMGKRRDEQISQARGDLARLERQATIDLDEMRQADMAIAASVLLKRPLSHPAPGGQPGNAR